MPEGHPCASPRLAKLGSFSTAAAAGTSTSSAGNECIVVVKESDLRTVALEAQAAARPGLSATALRADNMTRATPITLMEMPDHVC
jgi:hypothetical protein